MSNRSGRFTWEDTEALKGALEGKQEIIEEGARLLAWFLSYSLRENPHLDDIGITKEARAWLNNYSRKRTHGR